MTLRLAEPGDEAAVAGVHVRSWQAAYRALLPAAYLEALRAEDRAARYTFGDRGPGRPQTILAVDQGVICGFATVGPARDPDRRGLGELYALYLEPGRVGQGLGRALMADARRRLWQQGHAAGVLWVLIGNQRAERFYRADGWAPDGTTRSLAVHGLEVSERRYERSLCDQA